MTGVSTSYVEGGRSQQKLRTREQLVAAARELIESGDTPTVDEVARHSGISRTTAYRYFSTQADLLAAAFPETVASSLLPVPAPTEVEDRVAAAVGAFIDVVAGTEHQQRAMLRLSLGDDTHELPLRKGRAIGWFEEALQPLRDELGERATRALAVALRSTCGIEARVWLRDIAGLDGGQVRATQLWIADALVAQAREVPPPTSRPRRTRGIPQGDGSAAADRD